MFWFGDRVLRDSAWLAGIRQCCGSLAVRTHAFHYFQKSLAGLVFEIEGATAEQFASRIGGAAETLEQTLDAAQALFRFGSRQTCGSVDQDDVALYQTMIGRLELDSSSQLIAQWRVQETPGKRTGKVNPLLMRLTVVGGVALEQPEDLRSESGAGAVMELVRCIKTLYIDSPEYIGLRKEQEQNPANHIPHSP